MTSALRDRSFPVLDPRVLVHEDDDVVIVDKPPFVPTQASGAVRDDLPARLAAHLGARDGSEAYVGTHQRLDRDTSGLIAYAKRREANAWLARAFEGRRAEKRYVAAVSGRALPAKARWEDSLLDVGGDEVRVVARGTPGAKVARTEMEVIARRGDRALVSLRIETGRTHQIRAQLAHRGAPVAGDPWYGGAPWRRLGLASVSLRIPREGGDVEAEIEPPRSLRDFVDGRVRDVTSEPDEAEAVLRDASERRWALAHEEGTSCFRWAHEAGDGLAGLAVDVYGDHCVLHAYDDRDVTAFARALVARGAAGVYLKRRPRQASTLDEERTRELAPGTPLAGVATAGDEIEVRENHVPLCVRLGDGLSTGLFLDQRANRRRVRELAGGARVLNLFSYTCAFSIVAAAGGAREVTSVDAARKQLERGTRGFVHAGLDPTLHETIADDAFVVLDRLARRGRVFDVVVCDPPTYSSTKRTRFTSGKMWSELAGRLLRVLAPGGAVLATSNDRRLSQRDLRAAFQTASRTVGRPLAQLKDLPAPIDFPVLAGTEPHLKGVLVRG